MSDNAPVSEQLSFWHILKCFFVLGCISFGGPAAHIGYFQQEFVQKRGWLDNATFAKLTALTQLLPGPGSSQLGFAVGLYKGGMLGAIAAFIGFTLPSFLLMVVLALTSQQLLDNNAFNGVVAGLKLFAVVVVADAVITMSRSFCTTWLLRAVTAASAVALLLIPSMNTQLLILVIAGVAGVFMKTEHSGESASLNVKPVAMIAFVAIALSLPLLYQGGALSAMFAGFFQTGSLVFGGGHVVLPLLQETVADSMTNEQFLLGYAAAQAIPGPMFTMSAFLGAEILPESPWLAASVATLAIFLPGLLLTAALTQTWLRASSAPLLSRMTLSINAAVVGFLLAALYNPVWTSAVHSYFDMAIVVAGLVLLKKFKMPIVAWVMIFALGGLMRAVLS